MKTFRRWACAALVCAGLFSGCKPKPLYSGAVESVYYKNHSGAIEGFTRDDKGLPGAAMQVHEDVWVEVYPEWVFIDLKRRSYQLAIPSRNVTEITIGNPESNKLSPPK